MSNSKAVSIRIPDELLAKIDKLAEEKYKSHKGTPNRSLVILDAIVNYFDTLSDSAIDKMDIVSDNDIPSIMQRLEVLEKMFYTLSDTVSKLVETKVSIDEPLTKSSENESLQPNYLPLLRQVSKQSSELSKIKLDWAAIVKRLGSGKSTIERKKDIFAEWSREKDPDGISWQMLKDGHKLWFVPSLSDSDGELKSGLLAWIASLSEEE
jgi:predicted DNA-binding protein